MEIVRRVFEEFRAGLARGDPGAQFDSGLVAPDAEWVLPPGTPGMRPVYRGREEFIEFMSTWTEDFDWSIELERLVDAGGDRVVGLVHQRATGKTSGAPVEWHMGLVYELRDGLLRRTTNYLDPAEALDAAGLSE